MPVAQGHRIFVRQGDRVVEVWERRSELVFSQTSDPDTFMNDSRRKLTMLGDAKFLRFVGVLHDDVAPGLSVGFPALAAQYLYHLPSGDYREFHASISISRV
jgi:hypothetical protein